MSDPKCPFAPRDLERKGSRWILANFHTHTPGSFDYAKGQLPKGNRSPRDIARGILQDCVAQGVHVLAVTDHNSPSFVRIKAKGGRSFVDPEQESYYAMMQGLVRAEPDSFGDILVLPGVEIGAENIHVLGIFPPSDDPGWDVLKIAAILDDGNCPPEIYGDHKKSCTDYSVADAIDVIDERGGVAIPAHIDGASGFLKEESQSRLLKMIVSRPHLFALEYLKDTTRAKLEALLSKRNWRDISEARQGRSIAWTQSSDSHFFRTPKGNEDGNGMPLGSKGRRTWLRLDPSALTFEAVEAALLDPENRVRVDMTKRPRGRQGSYRPLSPNRTYVQALQLDWGDKQKEVLRFNSGINTFVGPPKAGKTARAQAFSVISGMRKDLSVVDTETTGTGRPNDAPRLKSGDMLLERGLGTKGPILWWLHREEEKRVFVAQVERNGKKLEICNGTQGRWVDLYPNGSFDRRALRDSLAEFAGDQAKLAPDVPQAFSLQAVKGMLDDPARTARFIEWHYAPDEHIQVHRQLHKTLRTVMQRPGTTTDAKLSKKLKELFSKLDVIRQEARDALSDLHSSSKVGLNVRWHRGQWTKDDVRKGVASALRASQPSGADAAFELLRPIEDRAYVNLKLSSRGELHALSSKERINIALRGLLLVIGARGLGPVVLDAPGAYFEPAELVETLAPLLLHGRDVGAQFVASVDDTNLPFAVDADLLFVCQRDLREGRVGSLDVDATGGLECRSTALWALKNLDGGGGQFARRMQLYNSVLGAELAERQRKLADVVLALGRSVEADPRGK